MDDEAFVAELLAILTNPHPTGIDPDDPYGAGDDGIDRCDGFGQDVIVTGLEVVEGEHGDELVVTFALALPDEPQWRLVPPIGETSLAFDAEWRELSGYGTPAAFAPWVADQTRMASRSHVERHQHQPSERKRTYRLPSRDKQWDMLVEVLGHDGSVRTNTPVRIEIERASWGDDEQRLLTVVITPEEWEQILEREQGDLDFAVGEIMASAQADERYLVVYRGRLEKSTREKLPPVRGTARLRRIAALQEANPDATFGWFAYPPE